MRTLRLLLAAIASAVVFGLAAPTVGRAGAAPPQSSTTSNSQPQPYSNADQNNVGANDTSSGNQYASTRNGAPSMNGNGVGNATGKPCAGCVGKADNKNPPGQYPNGSDPNNGYECDGNNGIGKTNPAHTGCTPATTTTEAGGATTTTSPGGGGGTTTTTEAGGGSGSSGSTTTTPDTSSGGGEAGRGGSSGTAGSSGSPNSAQAVAQKLTQWIDHSSATPVTRAATGSAGPLAFTGTNAVRYVLIGLFSMLIGTALYVLEPRVRRRLTATPR